MPYFDFNATAPLSAQARSAWDRAVDEEWANPSALYRAAARARLRLDISREKLADYLGASKDRVVFNSGATEGANAVLAYWADKYGGNGRILVASTEHSAVYEAANRWFAGRVDPVPLDSQGAVDVEQLGAVLSRGAHSAVCVMAANNETGVLQPWGRISECCRQHRVSYLCDATQWLGKLPASGLAAVDWLVASAHKWGGPKGVGILVAPTSASDFSSVSGGQQESGRRSGTENVPGVHAAVEALVHLEQTRMFLESDRVLMRDRFIGKLRQSWPGIKIASEGAERLWNTVLAIMPSGDQQRYVLKLDKLGFQVATGSACSAGKPGSGRTLEALGFSAEESRRALRFSSGWDTKAEDWDGLHAALVQVAVEIGANDNQVIAP